MKGSEIRIKRNVALLTLIKRNVDLYLLSVQFSTTIKRKISDSLFLKVKRRSILLIKEKKSEDQF